ncbi:hypothetical protein F4802DRAFT_552057 [Xylaria palmicola]|nr:hypothetical protein F4802DRAFT_552057 [Xylaria palmicola]
MSLKWGLCLHRRLPLATATNQKCNPDSFQRALLSIAGKDNQNSTYYFSRECRESAIKGGLQSGGINTKALTDDKQNPIIAKFCPQVRAVI